MSEWHWRMLYLILWATGTIALMANKPLVSAMVESAVYVGLGILFGAIISRSLRDPGWWI